MRSSTRICLALAVIVGFFWLSPAFADDPAPVPETAPSGEPARAATGEDPLGAHVITTRWKTEFYGFVEFDAIHDSTQSFLDLAGNQAIARPTLYAQDDQGNWVWMLNLPGAYGRTTFGARNSRLGFKIDAPQVNSLRASAVIEMDFLGNQPKITYPESVSGTAGRLSGGSENAFYTNPTLRIRHFAMKLETPYVDVLLGQYWQLFGWQGLFHPATVEIQGLPAQVFGRAPQVRLSHTLKSQWIDAELAMAAARPPQSNSETPDGQAGLRLSVNSWRGVHTTGATNTAVDPLSIGVSGVFRQFQIPTEVGVPLARNKITGWGVSVDGLIPIIPATLASRGNALTLTGSFVQGTGISDMYTGLTGGLEFPRIAAPAGATTPPVWPQNIDSGIVTYDGHGRLITIDWQSFMVGLQYHLPPSGRLWLSANYARISSDNIAADLDKSIDPWTVFTKADWADANLFWDVSGPVRLGLEYAYFRQTYADNQKVFNIRAQLSGWYVF